VRGDECQEWSRTVARFLALVGVDDGGSGAGQLASCRLTVA
jgi:hypothetical protein